MMMKYLIPLLPLLVLTACANPGAPAGQLVEPEVLADQLVERNGVTYRVDSDEPFTGLSVKYHDNGKLKNRTDYKDGKKDGLSEWFWENGTLGQRGNLKGGKKNGLLEVFSQNGKLIRSVNYKNGVRMD
jgi:hypothetical protein